MFPQGDNEDKGDVGRQGEGGYPKKRKIAETSFMDGPLGEEQRKCRFKFESGSLRLFTGYTQSACLFECQLEYSYNKCQCIPWNYPHFESGIPICHRFSQDCFEIAMGDTNSSAACDCPFDCATTRYTGCLMKK